LNTVLYYTSNNMTHPSEKDPGGQIAWLKNTLAAAKKDKEAVYIAGHIPIRPDGHSFRSGYVEPFLNAMKEYQSIIKGSFWGHHHVDTFQLIGDTPNNAHVAHLCGSISPQGDRNPTIRRYLVDTSKQYEVTSWRTFSMSIPEANKEGKMKWTTLFDSRTAYGLQTLTPSAIQSLATRLENDDKLFQTMWKHRFGGGPIGGCNKECKKGFLCSILHTVPAEYKKCMAK